MRSMRLFLLFSFIVLMLVEAYGFTDETDKQALLEFKSQVSEEKRVLLSSWNNSFPLCNWKGVTCGRKHKRVTRLHLGGLQLGGVISPSIGNLSFLISLDLSNNSFGGTIPQEVGNLFRLEHLDLHSNVLGGVIPVGLFNCSRLLNLYLYSNILGESVPSEIASLTKLGYLYLSQNKLRGKLPAAIGNLTSLRELSLAYNTMEGEVPDDIARLTQIVDFSLEVNKFSGVFPQAIYNLSSLQSFSIFSNGFSGSLRPDFGNMLPNLRELSMGSNNLTGAIPTTPWQSNPSSLGSFSSGDLEFLGALTNCTKLERLYVADNRLGGDLPTSIANLSTNLISLGPSTNLISGSIPHDIGNLINLQRLGLHENVLTGPLPISLGKLLGLNGLNVNSNRMSGEIPSSIGNITLLASLCLFNNGFEGPVPPSVGNCNLLRLWIGSNKLNGTIPHEIMKIQSLIYLDMSSNFLTGSLPEDVGGLEHLLTLSLAHNHLSGKLPHTLGNCVSMERLYLQGNSFDGVITDMRRSLSVKRVDLSNNNLSGSIPGYFANFSSLEYLNLSINNFDGKVPTGGKFSNATVVSVFGNRDLCGGIMELQLKPCSPPLHAKHSSLLIKKVAVWVSVGIGIALLLLVFLASVSLRWFRKRKKSQDANNPNPSTLVVFHHKISYGDLRNATDGFSSYNLIGSGSFGTVFRALLPKENSVVAVKVLNMQRRGAMKSFMAECEFLNDIRHRNLVKLLTACSSIDIQGNEFRALIYDFMPNGSLDMWLHPEDVEEIRRPSRTLTLLEDVASVLDYLHVHCHEPIAHCDLKPSNVLLDDDLIAHVSDFGLARLLLKFDNESFLNHLSSAGVRGTIGYAAPEYGMGGAPSIHGDVYSFGVLLLEIFTGKRPTNELFEGNFTLHSYIKSALPERVLEVADKTVLQSGLRVGFPVGECLTLVLEVGLRCCDESPTNRLATSGAMKELISIREKFFKTRRTARR